MRTVVVGERPHELDEWIARRRALGQDTFDEVWSGEYHVVPAPGAGHARVYAEVSGLLRPAARQTGLVGSGPFNLGDPADNYRVPDGGLHRGRPTGVYVPSAAAVIEVVSPGNETYDKFGFYAERGVEEIIVADPGNRVVQVWRLQSDRYTETRRSHLLNLDADHLTREVDWP